MTTTTDWRRDATTAHLCGCSHSAQLHRIDTKAQTCDVGGCPCPGFDLTHLRWRETRYVTEAVA